jgi:hypothetical protein
MATYSNQRASSKTYGQAITPETVRATPILPESISNENFETTAKVALTVIPRATDTILVAVVTTLHSGKEPHADNRMNEDDPILLDDDDRSRSEYYSRCANTAPLTDDSAKLPNTLDAFSLADTIPESVNKVSKTDIKGPDLDSEHVHFYCSLTGHYYILLLAHASLHSDNLYNTSDLSPLLYEKYRSQANALKSTNGSSRAKYLTTSCGLNPLKVLHVWLGHSSEDLIKWIVKSGVCDGLGYTYGQIKHLQLPLCDACMKSRMKAFPIPPSMTSTYGIFEYITLEIIHLFRKSCRGYKYSTLFVDKCSTKTFAYHPKRKSDLVTAFKKLLRDYHPHRFPLCLEMRILYKDFDSLVLDENFNLVEKNIRLRTTAPYKHQQ